MGVNVSKDTKEWNSYPSHTKHKRHHHKHQNQHHKHHQAHSNAEVVRSLQSLSSSVDSIRPTGQSKSFFQANKRAPRHKGQHESPLTREYNAWVRSLATHIDEDCERTPPRQGKHQRRKKGPDSWYTSLCNKVSSLVGSKRHRENAIVWPEVSVASVTSLKHTPKVRLSYMGDKEYLRDLRKKVVHSNTRRSVTDLHAADFDEAAFYMDNSFQCNEHGYYHKPIHKSNDSLSSKTSYSHKHDNSRHFDKMFTKPHGSKVDSQSDSNGSKVHKYQWDVAYDPYGGIQGASSVFGPKVLPTNEQPAAWHIFPNSSSSSLSKSTNQSATSVRDAVNRELLESNYSSFYGNDFYVLPKKKKKTKRRGRENGRFSPEEQRSEPSSFRKSQDFPGIVEEPFDNYGAIAQEEEDRRTMGASRRDFSEPTWSSSLGRRGKSPLMQMMTFNSYQTHPPELHHRGRMDLGPGGENFTFRDVVGLEEDEEEEEEEVVDYYEITEKRNRAKRQLTTNELTIPADVPTTTKPPLSPSPSMLWKRDSQMTSAMKTLRDHQSSPYHQMTQDADDDFYEWGKSHSIESTDDWIANVGSPPEQSYSSSSEDQHPSYVGDSSFLGVYQEEDLPPIDYARDSRLSGDYYVNNSVVTSQRDRGPRKQRQLGRFDSGLNQKLGNLVQDVFGENESRHRSKSRRRKSGRREGGAERGIPDEGQQSLHYVREIIESKLASALTSALVPNHPNNRSTQN